MAPLNDEGINALSAVRNLLVHKNGVVDAMFLSEEVPMTPSLTLFNPMEIGSPLLFDGIRVRQIVDTAISQGYNLLVEVDQWVSTQDSSIRT